MSDNQNDGTQWWSEPTKAEEVEPYLDQLFRYAGDSLWVKILRPYLKEELDKKLAQKAVGVEEKK